MRAKIACLFLLLLGLNVQASDLFAPFQGSRMSGLTRASTIAEYDGTTDASGNLLDLSGSNYCPASEQLDLWTLGSVHTSVVANQYRSPIDNQLSADSVKEYGASGGGDATAYHYIQKNMGAASTGVRYTASGYFRKVNRDWIMLQPYDATAAAERARASFNLSTGVYSSLLAGTTATISKVSGDWYRVSVSWVQPTDSVSILFVASALEGDNDRQYAGSDQVAFAMVGAQMAKNDQWRQGLGIYHPTTNSVVKPLLDLAPTGAPTTTYSMLQDRDGNRRQAKTFSGAGQFYSAAANTTLNVFDTSSTLTFVAKSDAAQIIIAFNSGTAGGLIVRHSNIIRWYKADGNYVDLNGPADYSVDGKYHTYQVVRNGDVATLLIDGAAGSPKTVAGYGIDNVAGLSPSIGSTSFAGSVLYTKVDAAALTQEELAKDREALQGTLAGSGNLSPGWTFTRTTTASMTYANGTIGYVAANVPRVGGDGGGVLVEEQRENKCLYSQDFSNAYWHKQKLSVPATSVVLPDGTTGTVNTIRSTSDAGDPQTRYMYGNAITTAVSSIYTYSIYLKAVNRTWAVIQVYDGTGAYSAYVNTAMCVTGTTAGGAVATAVQAADGWCRFSIKYTAIGTAALAEIVVADADGDQSTTGDDTDSYYMFGAQLELGAHPTSLITTTSAAVTRTQDSLTMEPWKLNKGVNPGLANPTMTARFESDVYPTMLYATEEGAKNFLVTGDTKRLASQTLGDYFSFDGTGDYLTRTDTVFNPSGDFTVVAIVTPSQVAANGVIFNKWGAAADYGWMLYQSTTSTVFKRSTTGSNEVPTTVASSMVAGKTSLITASFSTSTGMMLKADALTKSTDATVTATFGSSANTLIGATYTGALSFSGKVHLLKYINGYAATETDHDNMYAQLKQPNALPVKVGTSYEAKKLYVEFDAKCLYTGNSVASPYNLFSISGNTGSADTDTNNLSVYVASDKTIATIWPNGESTGRYMTTPMSTANVWHHYKFYWDFAELGNSTGYDDSTLFTNNATLTGAKDFDLTNTLIRTGQNYFSMTNGNCRVKNLRVRAAP